MLLADVTAPLRNLGDRLGALLMTSVMAVSAFNSSWDLGIAGGFTRNHRLEFAGQYVWADIVAFVEGLQMATASESPTRRDHVPEVAGARFRSSDPVEDPAEFGPDDRPKQRTIVAARERLLPAERSVVMDGGHFIGWAPMYLSASLERSVWGLHPERGDRRQMAKYGFLRRTDDGAFRLGHRFVRSALENDVLPVLKRLRDAKGETARLWVRRSDERICLLSSDSRNELRATLPPGSRLPLPAGSSGRLLAAEIEALPDVKAKGWVESDGARTPGLGSVSVPVPVNGRTLSVACLAMPLARVSVSRGEDFGSAAIHPARQISDAIRQHD